MAWDKLDALTIGPVLEVLGLIVDTDKMKYQFPSAAWRGSKRFYAANGTGTAKCSRPEAQPS
jgi:hypothetical protein